MAVHDFRCPNCNGSFRLSDMQLGKRLRCGKCNVIFTAPNAGELEPLVTIEPLAPPIVAKPLTTPSEEPAQYLTIEDEPSAIAETPKEDVPPPIPAVVETPQAEEDIPLRRRRRSAPDSIEPKRKVRRARDDDDDEREARPKAKVGMAALVLGGIAVAFIVGISVIGYVIYAGFQQATPANPVAFAPFPPAPVAIAMPNMDPFNPDAMPDPFILAMPREKPFVFLPAKVAAIRPAQLADDAGEIQLTSPAKEVVAGGGGRFLIFLQPGNLQLAIFDAQVAKIVKQFPLAKANALVAANATHAVVVYPDAMRMERYDLMTLKKDHDGPFVTASTVDSIAMGSASNGPLLAILNNLELRESIHFFDPMTTQRYTINVNELEGNPFGVRGRAAANGRMFVLSRWGFGGAIISLAGPHATCTKIKRDLYPGPDSFRLYGHEGPVTFPGERIVGMAEFQPREQWWPALHGNLAVQAKFVDDSRVGFESLLKLTIHHDGTRIPSAIATIPKLPLESGLYTAKPKQLDYADHLFLIPDAKLFVALDEKRTTLYLRRFDTEK